MIPAEAVEAATMAIYRTNGSGDSGYELDDYREDARAALEAAAPYMLIQVHHHDIEHHARSFNEGYETAMAQELAENPTTAQDWLDEKLREARAQALEEAANTAARPENRWWAEGQNRAKWLRSLAAAERDSE